MTLDPAVVIAGIGTLAATVVGAGIRKVWVWGWTFSDMERDRDFWRQTAIGLMRVSAQATDIATSKVDGA